MVQNGEKMVQNAISYKRQIMGRSYKGQNGAKCNMERSYKGQIRLSKCSTGNDSSQNGNLLSVINH